MGLAEWVDTQLAVEKIRVAVQVRNTHLAKRKRVDDETKELETKLADVESFVDEYVAKQIEDHPAYHWFSKVKGVGKKNIPKVVGLIEIVKAPTPSSLWKYAGYAPLNGKTMKPTKGQKLPYNKTLRSMCWRLADNLVRSKGAFYNIYLSKKKQEQAKCKDKGIKIVPTAKLPKKNGKYYEPEGVISEGHVDNRARRKMIKIFLACLWLVWREAEGLPLTTPYAEGVLGHGHIHKPWDLVEK